MSSDMLGDYKLEFTSILGSGSYGYVIKAHHMDTKVPVAVKRIEIDEDDEDQQKYLDWEVKEGNSTSSKYSVHALPPSTRTVFLHCNGLL